MTAALTAYLERLVHPARKAYATAYAAHILEGAAKPKAKGLEAETASKIARKVERYSKTMTTGERAGVSVQPEGLAHLPDAVRAYAEDHGDTELLGLVEAFVPGDQLPPAAPEVSERISDYYTPERSVAMVETAEVDVLDLTGLEPTLARELALKLARWNGGGKVYNRRNGTRYLNRTVRRIDLNDPTVQSLPNYEDLVAVVHERGVRA